MGSSCCLSDRSICFYNLHNLISPCLCQVAVFLFIRLHFCQTTEPQPEPCQEYTRKTRLLEQSWASAYSYWSYSPIHEFFHRVIKLYDVCIKWFRQGIHLCSVPYFPASPVSCHCTPTSSCSITTFMYKMYAFSFTLPVFLHPAHMCVHTHVVTDILYFLHFYQQVINTNYRGITAPAGITELHHAV